MAQAMAKPEPADTSKTAKKKKTGSAAEPVSGVHKGLLSYARTVLRADPELAKKVMAGKAMRALAIGDILVRGQHKTQESIMPLTDLQRALLEAESELGEAATLANDGTFGVRRARDNSLVLSPGTAAATIKTRVTSIRPSIGKITS
jgi:hypothetical protein